MRRRRAAFLRGLLRLPQVFGAEDVRGGREPPGPGAGVSGDERLSPAPPHSLRLTRADERRLQTVAGETGRDPELLLREAVSLALGSGVASDESRLSSAPPHRLRLTRADELRFRAIAGAQDRDPGLVLRELASLGLSELRRRGNAEKSRRRREARNRTP